MRATVQRGGDFLDTRRRAGLLGRTVLVRSADGIAATFVVCFGCGVVDDAPLRAGAVYNRRRVSREGRVLSNPYAETFDCGTARGRWSVAAIARLALPQHCELCVGRTGSGLVCDACARELPRIGEACPVCALPSASSRLCGACVARRPPFAATVAAFAYAFPTSRMLQRIKYDGRLALADWAGGALAAAVRAALAGRGGHDRRERPDRIVALPLAAGRQRERGFNQAREIAVSAARDIGLPLAAPLARIGARPPQVTLPWTERRRNVRGAFAATADVRGARIALVDDVMTTGATLAEASRTLVSAGAERVECWVVARTLPP
jgi:ComF family protein